MSAQPLWVPVPAAARHGNLLPDAAGDHVHDEHGRGVLVPDVVREMASDAHARLKRVISLYANELAIKENSGV